MRRLTWAGVEAAGVRRLTWAGVEAAGVRRLTWAGAARGVVAGALAGAAGTTALNAATYLDMAVRGRPASSTPQDSIERLADAAGVRIPGDEERRRNRLDGTAALAGLATGVALGCLLGLVRAAGWRPGPLLGTAAASTVALLGANGPMVALGITDPRTWSAADWIADLAPHLAYGAVTHLTLERMTGAAR